MPRSVKNIACVSALLACALMPQAAGAQQTGWEKTDTANSYDLTITHHPEGDASDDTITLRSDTAPPDVFAAASHAAPATGRQGKAIRLQGVLTTDITATGAALWIAAYAGTKQVAFSNTQAAPVPASSQNVTRTTLVLIPRDATRLVFGVLLKGKGKVTASSLTLSALDDEKLPDGTPLPEAVMQKALSDIKENAVNASHIDWKTETPRLLALSHTALLADVYANLRALIKNLDDHHSLVIPPWKKSGFEQMWRAPPEAKTLSAGINTIGLTGFTPHSPQEMSAYRDALLSTIRSLAPAKGWVLDLRKDQGGNMWPMLAGLKPFLGDAPLGYFVTISGEKSRPWKETLPIDHQDMVQPDLSTIPVAVLIGPHTASSGEAVAIAFKGRPNTRFFGTPTTGLTSSNRTFRLPDGGIMPIATSFEADRTGVIYKHGVEPDDHIEDETATIQAATLWLHTLTVP
ncbi:S41 family peptidase [Acetobacter senegalensis]|uniref:S41 family peptidase n=1 Tax=Acetobacter senegalensis TaxID=446692 RepID=UPI001ED9E6BF|nr:S41 family peptidase [Acetobacter senegalensis]MCG4254186.1 S41 family peptidase [Acetobacter senegalensis]